MQIQLREVDEAVEYGLERLQTPEEALAVAKALRESEVLDRALRIGEHGLSLQGEKGSLAVWLCELAKGMEQPETALKAAETAFRAEPG